MLHLQEDCCPQSLMRLIIELPHLSAGTNLQMGHQYCQPCGHAAASGKCLLPAADCCNSHGPHLVALLHADHARQLQPVGGGHGRQNLFALVWTCVVMLPQIPPPTYMTLWSPICQVNVAMAGTGLTQLARKLRHDYGQDAAAAAEQADGLSVSKEA